MGKDPTKTLTLRRKAAAEINRRFNELKRVVRITLQAPGLITNAEAVEDGRFLFIRDSEKIPVFDEWFREQVDREIMQELDPSQASQHWLNGHIGEGYIRGAQKTRLAAERNIPDLIKVDNYSPLTNPFHVERAELIFTRAFNDLKGVTDVMANQVSRELATSMINGEGVKRATDRITDRVDKIGKTRAKLIARTEIVESHNTAAIEEARQLEEDTGVETWMEWNTAIDGRERQTHHDRHEKVYTREKTQTLIGEPNCRCSVTAVFGADAKAKLEGRDVEVSTELPEFEPTPEGERSMTGDLNLYAIGKDFASNPEFSENQHRALASYSSHTYGHINPLLRDRDSYLRSKYKDKDINKLETIISYMDEAFKTSGKRSTERVFRGVPNNVRLEELAFSSATKSIDVAKDYARGGTVISIDISDVASIDMHSEELSLVSGEQEVLLERGLKYIFQHEENGVLFYKVEKIIP